MMAKASLCFITAFLSLLPSACATTRSISLETHPEDARIYVNGNYVGSGTASYMVRAKPFRQDRLSVSVEHPNYGRKTYELTSRLRVNWIGALLGNIGYTSVIWLPLISRNHAHYWPVIAFPCMVAGLVIGFSGRDYADHYTLPVALPSGLYLRSFPVEAGQVEFADGEYSLQLSVPDLQMDGAHDILEVYLVYRRDSRTWLPVYPTPSGQRDYCKVDLREGRLGITSGNNFSRLSSNVVIISYPASLLGGKKGTKDLFFQWPPTELLLDVEAR